MRISISNQEMSAMKPKRRVMLFTFFVLFSFSGCSIRYMKYKKAIRMVQNGEMMTEQFDEKFYTFYSQRKALNQADTSLPIKFNGSYVNQDTDGKYRAFKFSLDGSVTGTWKMNAYPTNLSVLDIATEHHYYKLEGNTIDIEYLQSRDWKLYNIVKTGKIVGDSIVFFQAKTIQLHWAKPRIINDVYVYDKNLTSVP
jgi:hypothetical protein